jgi:methylated-DNA-[protein]-cysteine S-methyltransferase
MESPLGSLRLVGDGAALTAVLPSGGPGDPGPAGPAGGWVHDPTGFEAAVAQLDAYFAGRSDRFDLPLGAGGTAFERQVWQALAEIPYGTTATYGELAARIGRPGAARAVGAAAGRNPLLVVVPCHRLVGADGALTGYRAGIDRKRWLLDHEAAVATPAA